jgi:hypothetical protein
VRFASAETTVQEEDEPGWKTGGQAGMHMSGVACRCIGLLSRQAPHTLVPLELTRTADPILTLHGRAA